MVFNYFYTIVFLVGVLLLLNIINRVIFMRFVKKLPSSGSPLKINDLLDQGTFERLIRKMDSPAREQAVRTRSWLIKIIISMFVVVLLLIIVGIFSYIK